MEINRYIQERITNISWGSKNNYRNEVILEITKIVFDYIEKNNKSKHQSFGTIDVDQYPWEIIKEAAEYLANAGIKVEYGMESYTFNFVFNPEKTDTFTGQRKLLYIDFNRMFEMDKL